jgi:stage IV sporulation protein B
VDVDTKKLMSVKSGVLTESSIHTVRKGKKGNPGELIGEIRHNRIIGEIKTNSRLGLFGKINSDALPNGAPSDRMLIATQQTVREGPAKIRSNVSGQEVREYDIFIEAVNRNSADESKGMVIRITDGELISATNGIVQGMSGSPIIQDGRLIGAVTHVFVQNPQRGYGIFIENMLRAGAGAE